MARSLFIHYFIVLCLCLVTASKSTPFWDRNADQHERQHYRISPSRGQNALPLKTRELYHTSGALASCEEDALLNEEALKDIDLHCKCEEVDGGVTLICADSCAYCNTDQTVCGINSAQAFYDGSSGLRTAIGGIFQYQNCGLHGDTLAVQNLGCVEDESGRIASCQTCNVHANNQMCNSCEFQTCSDGRVEEKMDCSNIEEGAIFDFCEDVTITSGVFQAFSSTEFKECLPLSVIDPITTSSKSSKSGKSSKKSFAISDYSKSAKKMKSRIR